MKIYKPHELASLLGVTVATLQRWDRMGQLPAKRNPSNRRYYTQDQVDAILGNAPERGTTEGKVIIYARVSDASGGQKMRDQVGFLRQYANARGLIVDQVMEEYGSGMDYDRPKWNALLEDCLAGRVAMVLIAHEDRFVRFGYEWYQRLLSQHHTQIVVVNNEDLSPRTEIMEDLSSILTESADRIEGLGKYRNRINADKDIAKELK